MRLTVGWDWAKKLGVLLQLLQGDAIARLILMTHRQLHRARGNRHQRRSLGPLIALLSMLGDLVCTPGAFRHTVHILLQHLHVRSALAAPLCF